ncbi:MAG: hypothetical protein RLN88_03145 [Ekhidna sp.]|uniref:TPR end-of-group domain-containing protein n=1 Tax=Ekhidna sp. TaxID=2608089 RepID=UPI0032EEF534
MRKNLYSLFVLCSILSYSQSLRDIYQEGMNAYEEKNYELFKQKMFTIDTMRPNYPAVVYNLAGGYALTGNKVKSIETLNKYILMDATQDFSKDNDFAAIIESPDFEQIVEKQKLLTSIIEPTDLTKIPILSSHPESITYSQKQKAFFIGGVRDGNIWKVEQDADPIIWAESPKNSWSVMGLDISPDNKHLWVGTSSMSNYASYIQNEEGFASVLKYDLKSGELLETFVLPGGHNFGDLIADTKGNIFISDGTANKLYWIENTENQLKEFADLSNQVFNLQGLTLNENETALFLSDYIDGIYKLDLASKALAKLDIVGEGILIKGIDGLYFKDNSLLCLHNGTTPNRVVKYLLSEDGNSILSKETLAQSGSLGEPTQGIWIGDRFYFIMNSPWAAYSQDGIFSTEGDSLFIGIIE